MNPAMVIIDFINDIVHPEGKLKSCAEQCRKRETMAHAKQCAIIARSNNVPVIHVKVGFDKNWQLHPEHSPFFGRAREHGALQLDTWGTEFHEAMEIKPADSIVIKSRISAFYTTSLETILRANNINHVYLCGVSTTWAIEATARDAHDRDYRVTIIEDACAARTEEAHLQSIKVMSAIADITTTGFLAEVITQKLPE